MRIVLSKVGEKGGVREGEQPGRVVSHGIGGPRDVVVSGQVAVETTMQTVDPEEVSSGPVGGDGAFAATRDGWKVVIENGDGGLANVGERGEHGLVADDASEFQITVGDAAGAVRGGDDVGLDVRGKHVTPHMTQAIGGEPHTAHAVAGRVACAEESGDVRNEFGEAGRAGGDGEGQDLEII